VYIACEALSCLISGIKVNAATLMLADKVFAKTFPPLGAVENTEVEASSSLKYSLRKVRPNLGVGIYVKI
jgi:hypothetical protein